MLTHIMSVSLAKNKKVMAKSVWQTDMKWTVWPNVDLYKRKDYPGEHKRHETLHTAVLFLRSFYLQYVKQLSHYRLTPGQPAILSSNCHSMPRVNKEATP